MFLSQRRYFIPISLSERRERGSRVRTIAQTFISIKYFFLNVACARYLFDMMTKRPGNPSPRGDVFWFPGGGGMRVLNPACGNSPAAASTRARRRRSPLCGLFSPE